MAQEGSDPIERWMAKRRLTLVVSILKGETSVAEAARTHGLTVPEGVPKKPRLVDTPKKSKPCTIEVDVTLLLA